MPTLVHFSDNPGGRWGLGATIRLNSGEPCLVSCAQSGVRVRKTRFGFFGPVLYDEKNILRAAMTAKALDTLFPDSLLPLGFLSSVLTPFANAILHCASCAEVAIILNGAAALNEATARVETQTKSEKGNAQLLFGHKCIQSHNYAEAVKWYRCAADEGNAQAQSQLGCMYAIGKGVSRDYAEAAKWCRNAADQGDIGAQSQLGDMYAKGHGVPMDYTKAAHWCSKAAGQGHAMAQLLLGALYHNGQGVPQDYVQAHMWLGLAASGFPASDTESINKAVHLLNFVAAKMTSSDVACAQDLAREWISR